MVGLAISEGREIVRLIWFVIFVWALTGCSETEYEVEDVPTGYRGEARVNPYLAAERFVRESGRPVKSSRVWADFGDETGVVFMPGAYLRSKAEGIRVLDWVAGGGLLVLTVEGGEPERNDFTTNQSGSGVPKTGDFPGFDYLLDETEIEVSFFDWSGVPEEEMSERGHLARAWHVASLKMSDDSILDLEFEGNVGLRSETSFDWEGNGELPSRVVSTYYGQGRVVVMAHARPLRSPYLDRLDHAAFIEVITNWDTRGEVVFLYGSNLTFLGLLWQRAWMVLLPGLILLAGWLWMRIPRFGPVMEDQFQTKKPYGESLAAEARFLWRRGKVDHYIRPLRARLELDHQGDPATLYQRLADQTGLTKEEVAEALTLPPTKDSGTLIKLVQKLQVLLKR